MSASIPDSAGAPDFSGLWIPLVTPFRGNAIDHAALHALARRLAREDIAGFVVCGSTAEAAALSADEQLAVLGTVANATPTLPRMMGVSGYHLGHVLAWVERLNALPLAGLLVNAPYGVRPSQPGLRRWFEAIAQASQLPIVIYDIPYRTGATLALDTLRALAGHPRIRGVKDCGGDAAKTRALIADGQLQVFAGEDAQIFTTLAEGGAGAMAASAHLHTAHFVQMMRAINAGRLADARTAWRRLLPLIEALFAEPNPAPLKAALAMTDAGFPADLRVPMTPVSSALRKRLAQLLENFSRP